MKSKIILTLGTYAIGSAISAENKPNLLIIHTDEQSFRTLSCYQQNMSEDQAFVWGKGMNSTTPNIDKIAREGAICMNYYAAAPVSTPSRAALVSGRYPHATGAWKNGLALRQDIPTFATELRKAGYATSYIGKWHLSEEHDIYEYNIKYNGGFDDNTYMTPGGHAPYLRIKDGKIIDRGINQNQIKKVPMEERVHYTDFYTEKTIERIERDKDKPFCIMVSIPDPHTPDYATGKYHTMYDHLRPTQPVTMSDELLAKRPSWAGGEKKNDVREFDPEKLKQNYGMIKHIDDAVGRMLATLEKNGLKENTIVIFTSDHGDMFFEHNRMNKGNPYEASARVPFVIRYPKGIPSGKVITSNYVNVNFAPTILSLMGIKSEASFQGVDTANDFTSKDKTITKPRFTHYAAVGGYWACALEGQYKLVLDKKEIPWLIDLKADPNELTNFASDPKYKKIVNKMSKELLERLKKVDAPIQTFNTQGLFL